MNYKKECLKINPDLRASKVSGCALYHIIVGSKCSYKGYSDNKDTINEAWKSCYEYLTK